MKSIVYVFTGTFLVAGVFLFLILGMAFIFAPLYFWCLLPSHPVIATVIGFLLMISTQVVQGIDW